MAGPPLAPQTHLGRWPPILKPPRPWPIEPFLTDSEHERAFFSWATARRGLDGLPGGRGLNSAHEAVDRHAAGPLGQAVALRWLGRTGERQEITYHNLRAWTNRFANVLRRLGVGKGDVVATLMGRIPAQYVAALGALKNLSVYTPLFSAFGPDPIVARLTRARARVLVSTSSLYQRKVEPIRAQLPDLEHVLLVGDGSGPTPAATRDLATLMASEDE